MRYALFLRGINVGGHRKVPMRDLAALCTSLGFSGVRTYLNSGNVVFEADRPSSQRIEEAMERALGFPVDVALRTVEELEAVLREMPFPPEVAHDPSRLLIAFYIREADTAPATAHQGPELVHAGLRHAWVYYPDGVGRSKLDLERLLKTRVTARNVRTVTALTRSNDG